MTRGDVWWVALDPGQGSEIKKTRPCVVLTHNTLNQLRKTVVVVPLSTAAKPHPPITVPVICQGRAAVAVIDQIRAVAKHRLWPPRIWRQSQEPCQRFSKSGRALMERAGTGLAKDSANSWWREDGIGFKRVDQLAAVFRESGKFSL
jgi:mRNA interferase MazF